ncbi:uroporphyrinogen-III synthase [Dinoroseobacter sp. S375]|uniref:uroporphyrinogen-III synthase n=1 Tax=Dinoroseobacter sp. S375 TaxID=3415136 RepID=UPI003C7E5F47
MVRQPPLPVLLTRPRAQAEAFAATLPDTLAPVITPLLRIETRDGLMPAPPEVTLIFTSANGVARYPAAPDRAGQRALCVGARTAELARAAGYDAQSAEGTAEDVLALALTQPGPFLHIRGAHARGEIAARLRAAGKDARDCIAYDQLPCPLTDAARAALTGPCLVPLFSPRTAAIFAAECPAAPDARIVAMSTAVASALDGSAYAGVETLKTPTAAAMRAALLVDGAGNRLETGRSSG